MTEENPATAQRIEITGPDHEAELRAFAQGIVAYDVIRPEVAYSCATCGTVLAFGHRDSLIHTNVVCQACGAVNAI